MTTPSIYRHPSDALTSTGLGAVLLPLDFTPTSDRALRRLSLLPLAEGARVVLLHVVPDSLPRVEQLLAVRAAERALSAELQHLKGELRKSLRVEQVVKIGVPSREIADFGRHIRADLTLMGRGGWRPLSDMFLGCTAERVVRRARRPVLVVRRPARANYRRAAIALDLEQAAHDMVPLMLRLLSSTRPTVEVVHAFHSYRSMVPSVPADGQLQASATRELKNLLAVAVEKANIQSERRPVWRTRVHQGSPPLVVAQATRDADTELLVLGSRGRSGLAHLLWGTVAGQTLRAAECDVLIVPRRVHHS